MKLNAMCILVFFFFLSGCDDDRHIFKMASPANNIDCVGMDRVTGSHVVVIIDKGRTIIQFYDTDGNDGLIVGRDCIIH